MLGLKRMTEIFSVSRLFRSSIEDWPINKKGNASEKEVISLFCAYLVSTLLCVSSGIKTRRHGKDKISENHLSASSLTGCALHTSLHTWTFIKEFVCG